MSWSSRKKQEGNFSYRIFFNICVLSQCIVYRIHFQNIHTFTYQKTFHTLFCLFLKQSKAFSVSLKTIFSRIPVRSWYQFDKIFLNVLEKHAPSKQKLLRANHSSYISKPLRKAIMRRYYSEKVYYKNKSEKSFKAYKKQKNFVSRLYKKKNRNGFSITSKGHSQLWDNF